MLLTYIISDAIISLRQHEADVPYVMLPRDTFGRDNMKKIISAITSISLAACITAPSVYAADADYTPTMYFRADESAGVKAYSDGNAAIFRTELGDAENVVVKASVYIADESLSCWYVHPVWKSASEYAKLENLGDPLPMSDTEPNVAYAYAETDENGEFIHIRHGTLLSTNNKYNTMSFTCQVTSRDDRSEMKPYGEKSDSYPLTWFDVNMSMEAPAADYTVYFLTEHEDYADQRLVDIAMRTEESSVVKTPITIPMTITVTDRKFGDVNGDDKVDANDASAILVAYSNSSTGQENGLTNEAFRCGDTDLNSQLTSADASNILSYYSFLSTSEEKQTLTQFMEERYKQ